MPIVFKIENNEGLPPLIVVNAKDFNDYEATIGEFLCVPGEEQWVPLGTKVTITAIEMSEAEIEALPEWEV